MVLVQLVGGCLVLMIQTHCELCLVGHVGSSGVLKELEEVAENVEVGVAGSG